MLPNANCGNYASAEAKGASCRSAKGSPHWPAVARARGQALGSQIPSSPGPRVANENPRPAPTASPTALRLRSRSPSRRAKTLRQTSRGAQCDRTGKGSGCDSSAAALAAGSPRPRRTEMRGRGFQARSPSRDVHSFPGLIGAIEFAVRRRGSGRGRRAVMLHFLHTPRPPSPRRRAQGISERRFALSTPQGSRTGLASQARRGPRASQTQTIQMAPTAFADSVAAAFARPKPRGESFGCSRQRR